MIHLQVEKFTCVCRDYEAAIAAWLRRVIGPCRREPTDYHGQACDRVYYSFDMRGPKMLVTAQATYERTYGGEAKLRGSATRKAKQLLELLRYRGAIEYHVESGNL